MGLNQSLKKFWNEATTTLWGNRGSAYKRATAVINVLGAGLEALAVAGFATNSSHTPSFILKMSTLAFGMFTPLSYICLIVGSSLLFGGLEEMYHRCTKDWKLLEEIEPLSATQDDKAQDGAAQSDWEQKYKYLRHAYFHQLSNLLWFDRSSFYKRLNTIVDTLGAGFVIFASVEFITDGSLSPAFLHAMSNLEFGLFIPLSYSLLIIMTSLITGSIENTNNWQPGLGVAGTSPLLCCASFS